MALGATGEAAAAISGRKPGVVRPAGALAGISLAAVAMPLLNYGLRMLPTSRSPRPQPIALNLPVLAFTALLAILTGSNLQPVPGGRSAPALLNDSLRDGQRTVTAGRKPYAMCLPPREMAFAVVVLFTAALLLRSFQKLLAVDPGFRTDHLLAVKIDLPATSTPPSAGRKFFHPPARADGAHPRSNFRRHHQRAAADPRDR